MKVSKSKYFRKFTVIFGPDETDKFLDDFPNGRCLYMKPRSDLKPWGTREAMIEEELDISGLIQAVESKKFQRKKKV